MKKAQKFVALFLVAAVMTLAACEKENTTNNNNSQPQPRPAGISLAGTSWENSIENSTTATIQGYSIEMNISMLTIIDLNDERNGEQFNDFTLDIPMIPSASQHQTGTDPITYNFDGSKLILTYVYENEEYYDTLLFRASDSTFLMAVPDYELDGMGITYQDLMGTDTMVFTKTRGTLNF